MKNAQNTIECPKCGEGVNVSEVLAKQVEASLRMEFKAREAEREQELRESLSSSIREETGEELKELRRELAEKSTQVRDLSKARAEVERLKREKDELRDEIALEKERELTERLKAEKGKIRTNLEDEYLLKFRELEKQLDDQKRLAEEMKRKAEQGSVQLQGEVQELELESMLRELYVYDEITEVKKGARGADSIQIVRNHIGADCGKIYYESKRTKNFDHKWLAKFREDNMAVQADVLVLVTEAMPDGCDGFTQIDGVWVCSFKDVKSLSFAIRQGLLTLHEKLTIEQGKETKAEMLYAYLTGIEFRGEFQAIVEGFSSIQDGYNREKMQMAKIWKEREKQLARILTSTANFYGSVRGIAGAAVPEVKLLEGEQSEPLALPE